MTGIRLPKFLTYGPSYIFLVGSLALSLGLFPTIASSSAHVPLETSLPVVAVLGIYAVVFAIAKDTVSSLGMAFQTLAWMIVALLRH